MLSDTLDKYKSSVVTQYTNIQVEKEKERERRMETRRLELEILSEMKRPVEDMAVPDQK